MTGQEIPFSDVKIQDDFWDPRLQINAREALSHQWYQLEKTGCIENFRLVAGEADGIRKGYFFADSDAYKWLEAAARVYASYPTPWLKARMDEFITLIRRAQTEDGYLFTYNQLNFPGRRWVNLQIEHELYCLGHLIEAGVSHYQAMGDETLLEPAVKAANLLVRDFAEAGPDDTPGHEEIEIALIRLYHLTSDSRYLDLAEHFIEQRGRIKPFLTHIYAQNRSFTRRARLVDQQHAAYLTAHPEHAQKFQLPPENEALDPPRIKQRFFFDTATGKYFQQHTPVHQQTIPEGHAVRFAYLETAVAMLYQERGDEWLLATLRKAWEHMVTRRMYVSGGIGSLPLTEGFGRDYELDPKYAYAETCAALGIMFWNWQMALISGEARYSDLFEWQLYNAASVGIGQDGVSYLYNNPLSCASGLTREPWFRCACCPSNLSRTWADLGRYIYTFDENTLWMHQYIGNHLTNLPLLGGMEIDMRSELPWAGKVSLTLHPHTSGKLTLMLRVPGWSGGVHLRVNGVREEIVKPGAYVSAPTSDVHTASGYDPRRSWFLPLTRLWSAGDTVEFEFETPVVVRRTHPKVHATRGKAALSRGPLLYCLESVDNPGVDIFNVQLDPKTLTAHFSRDHFGGVTLLRGRTLDGQRLLFIPYYLWANRGESQMTVFVNTS
ncbi:MAG: glycoside hydrolase family 127 protein [Chloroflexota bacterium]|nr:glycoside hydrolase family 127 protein [Chloroflexota bacterium]